MKFFTGGRVSVSSLALIAATLGLAVPASSSTQMPALDTTVALETLRDAPLCAASSEAAVAPGTLESYFEDASPSLSTSPTMVGRYCMYIKLAPDTTFRCCAVTGRIGCALM